MCPLLRRARRPPTPRGSYLTGPSRLKLPGRGSGGCVGVVFFDEAGVDVLDDLVTHGGQGQKLQAVAWLESEVAARDEDGAVAEDGGDDGVAREPQFRQCAADGGVGLADGKVERDRPGR